MGNTVTKPLTIEQFEQLDLPEDREWELHGGELVGLLFPSLVHKLLQQRLEDIFRSLFPGAVVLPEFPFQIRERLELRSAYLGVTSQKRIGAVSERRILEGAPDFVVEVLSPSNSVPQLNHYRKLCLDSGTSVFWVVDPDDQNVDVYLKGQRLHRVWERGEEIPIALFGREVTVAVDEIFRGVAVP